MAYTSASARPDLRGLPAGLPPFLRVGGHPALDFLNSLAQPSGTPIDWLDNGDHLVGWLADQGFIDMPTATHYRSKRFTRKALDAVAAEARGLREWFRDFMDRRAGEPLASGAHEELARLNRLLASSRSFRRVERVQTADGSRDRSQAFQLASARRWESADELLQPLAESIGDLICNADFSLIRRCEGHDCTMMFYDTTRRHARRWCSMAICGNRHKAAAHRARVRHK